MGHPVQYAQRLLQGLYHQGEGQALFGQRLLPGKIMPLLALSFLLGAALAPVSSSSYADPMPEGPAADPSTSLYHFNQARHFERDGQWDKAEAEFRQAVFRAPNDYLNYVRLAAYLASFGKTNEAISNYQKAIALNPNDPMLHFSLGGLYESLGEYASAKREYEQGVRQNPEYVYGYYNLAKVLMQSADYNEAEAAFQRFLAKYPNHYEAQRYLANLYLVNNKPEQAANAYETIKRNFPDKFSDSINLARALTQADAPELALEELKTAYAKEGNKADILEAMGNAHIALGQDAYAIHNYEQSYALDETRYPLLLKVAEGYQKEQKNDQAIGALKKYLDVQPENQQIHHWYANLLVQQKQYNQAYSELNGVLDKTQDPKERYQLEKEIAFVLQSKGDIDDAITKYEALLQEPESYGDAQLKTNLAIAYHKTGQLDKAAPLYETVYRQLPQASEAEIEQKQVLGNDLANVLTQLADQSYQQQEYQQAGTLYAQATQYASAQNAMPFVGLGNAHFALQQLDLAETAYAQALSRDPQNVLASLYLGKVQLQRNMPDAAIEQLEGLVRNSGLESGLRRDAYLTLGDAYQQAGKLKDAALSYEQAQGIAQPATGSLQPQINQQTNQQANTSDTINALPDANRQQDINLLLTQGNLWQQLKEFPKAKAAYEKVLQIEPNNAKAHYNLGIVYNELGQLPQSVSAYQQAIKADPNFQESRYGLAVTYEKQQKYKDALSTYQEYLKAPNALYAPQAQERVDLLQQALKPAAKQG